MKWTITLFIFLFCLTVGAFFGSRFLEKGDKSKLIGGIATQRYQTTPTPAPLPPLQFSAWIPWWDEEKNLESLKVATSKLKYISPVWYKIDNLGNFREIKTARKNEVIKIASESGILLIPTIGNDFDGNRINKLLLDNELRQSLVEKMILDAQENGFIGWDLDWEEIKETDKALFSDFVGTLATTLRRENLKLIVTVHAQTGKTDDWVGSKGQDWKELSKNADAIRIMAYDFHHSKSHPGPVTPIDKLKEVLDYAVSIVPLEKLIIGLPTYGYDWAKGVGEPVQYEDAIRLILSNNGSWSRDRDSSALHGTYIDSIGSKHEVWFEDKVSIVRKISIAKEYGVYQYCFWSLGGEDKAIWGGLSF